MSKVVKGVGRAISKVVKGVANVVKKVASSKFGKILVGAALIYFGGAALMGGFSGAAAGGGLSGALSGAAQGVANAWTSLTGAASSALGGKFAQAGSQLSAGIQGTTTALQGEAALSAASQAAQSSMTAGNAGAATNPALLESYAGTPGYGASSAGAGNAAMTTIPGSTGPGLISRAASGLSNVWNSMGDRGQAATITGGTQLVGGLIQGYGMQKAQDRQEQLTEEQLAERRAKYNANVGGFSFAPRLG